jgi:2-polyprenyl-3-methyl-5-hydroxy-6-metoxy-1,4-benzoquinol methylase
MNSEYWNNVYNSKNECELSWFQNIPLTSLKLINELKTSQESSIIDIGGGDSRLVDNLIEQNFFNISVLDISAASLEKVKVRLKEKSDNINFIVSDILEFSLTNQFDFWHDRAAFHFLTDTNDIKNYIQLVSKAVKAEGHVIISTFAKNGPDKCSGLPISKYNVEELIALFSDKFKIINHLYETHQTPWSSSQNFVYCTFKKENN